MASGDIHGGSGVPYSPAAPGSRPILDGPGGPGISRVEDPEKLSKAGEGATQLAGRTKSLGKHPEDETRAAARTLDGQEWGGQLGEALHHLHRKWSSQTEAQSGRCHTVSRQCATTSQNFTQTETANTNTVNSANNAAIRRDFG